jgi:hypothetical protein
MKRVKRKKDPWTFPQAWTDHFVSDKFGAATTDQARCRELPLKANDIPFVRTRRGRSASSARSATKPQIAAWRRPRKGRRRSKT